jgi:hypothetical protein
VDLDRRGLDLDLLVAELGRHLAVEQRLDLLAELGLVRMDRAVRVDELVDGRQQLLLVVAVEALEDLERAQLELGVALTSSPSAATSSNSARTWLSTFSNTSWKCATNLETTSARVLASASGINTLARSLTICRM